MRRALISGTLFILAPLIALHAQVGAGNDAPEWAESFNGFRLAERSLNHIQASRQGEERLDIAVDPKALDLARSAHTKEPLAANSHFVLSLEVESRSRDILLASRMLDKRNRLTALILLQSAAEQQELIELMSLVEELARLEPELASQFVASISSSLTDPRSFRAIKAALLKRPSWESAFWRSIPASDEGLNRFLALRNELKPTADAQATQRLIRRLVEAERFDEAFEIDAALKVAENGLEPSSALGFHPIDWQVSSARFANARLNASGDMNFYVAPDSAGEIARKLVAIKPGSYQLLSKIAVEQGSGELSSELICANEGKPASWTVKSLASTPKWRATDADCSYAWIVLKGAAWNSQIPLEGRISDLKFKRLENDDAQSDFGGSPSINSR